MKKEIKKGKIIISKDGPYFVSGNLPLEKETIITDEERLPCEWKKGKKYPEQETYALCRCGKSKNMPYCDGTHVTCGFKGTETADRRKYFEQVDSKTEGPELDLTDVESLCARARFCERKGSAWNLTENSDDPLAKKTAIEQACNCPSGRLVALDKETKKAYEPEFEESLSLVEDPEMGVSGPIWVKGRVQIKSSDGHSYEKRNRVTLCRCGQSGNKPFCDGSHIESGFDDGDETLK
ncbi:MAG TPA: CDGSH iron-sulfur domain-containing protein [Candidatus Moranbacteria bacterium]|nr:CDGSH iron-sulfur domain-containing protein [Candidatus Moranbacteria bacterium]HRY27909.1 CDGSH iron-sulfur domain-containing protein [Candidatus Moranbacteria bacterium]HSA08380.1 CDGSH iron-sulfur domain-containing protein [Candidatus Moranbacteria bacterium]